MYFGGIRYISAIEIKFDNNFTVSNCKSCIDPASRYLCEIFSITFGRITQNLASIAFHMKHYNVVASYYSRVCPVKFEICLNVKVYALTSIVLFSIISLVASERCQWDSSALDKSLESIAITKLFTLFLYLHKAFQSIYLYISYTFCLLM